MDSELIARISPEHQRRLAWFEEHQGEVSASPGSAGRWPAPGLQGRRGSISPVICRTRSASRSTLDSPYEDGVRRCRLLEGMIHGRGRRSRRLALLQTELNSIQASIRNFDSMLFQIRGWCVTTALAAGGFAVAYHKPALILVGGGAVLGFFMINCQFRMFQRGDIKRNIRIDTELKHVGIMQVLRGAGSFDIVGTAAGELIPYRHNVLMRIRKQFPDFWFEIRRPSNFSLYLFVSFCLLIELVVLLL